LVQTLLLKEDISKSVFPGLLNRIITFADIFSFMDKAHELGEGNIPRLMVKYFIPAFIGVFVNALYNIVDRIFIGQGVSAVALSAVSVIFPVMLIMMALGMLIGIGAGVLVSINMGRRDLDKAERVLGNSFVLMVLSSGLITLIGFLIKGPMLEYHFGGGGFSGRWLFAEQCDP
jgi:Na+-driven multidrug efflux pump